MTVKVVGAGRRWPVHPGLDWAAGERGRVRDGDVTVSVVARSVHGIEWVCAEEIARRVPRAREVSLARREVAFQVPAVDPALVDLRTVDDVFLRVGEVGGVGTGRADLPLTARRLARLDWERVLEQVRRVRSVPSAPRFDVVASIEGRRRYNRYEVQDAVGAALAPVLRGRYLTRTGTAGPAAEPELTVRVFVRGPSAVAALRLAARPLHRRGYKADTGAGTLHPPLAAAMVRLADPPPGGVLLDPFAGDGTIAVESALAYPRTRAVAADLDPRRLANAARNAARAGAAAALVRADAAAPPWRPGRVTTVVTNPPWNLAVDARGALVGSLERFWRQLPDLLAAAGRACLLTDAELAAPAALERAGFQLALATRLRLAGRISHLILCAPAGQPRPGLPGDLGSWRRRARSCGVVTDDGF